MSRSKRSGTFQSVKQLLANHLPRELETDYRQLREIVTHWAEIVGVFLAERMSPSGLENGVLICYVPSSSLIQELSFLEKEILSKLKTYSFGVFVKELRFTTQVKQKKLQPSPNIHSKQSSVAVKKSLNLTDSESKRLADSVSSIQDPVVRERTLHFLRVLAVRQKNLQAERWKHCNRCHSFYQPELKTCFYCGLK